jgi:4a-hydroxytetrahydrobiopterin dehydratase
MSPLSPLSPQEAAAGLSSLKHWKIEHGELIRTFQFPDFVGSIAFVNKVADLAEKAGHHPDIDIRYNRVKLALVSHDAGGITARDAGMAARLSADSAVSGA